MGAVRQIMILAINTDRLRLESLSVEVLKSLVNGDLNSANELLSFKIPSSTSRIGFPSVKRRLDMIETDSSQHPWMYRAIIRKSSNKMVGVVSFHHKAPDPDLSEFSSNGAELGYTIDPAFRRMGYATESILGMIGWANKESGTKDMFVSISPENEPSMKLAKSLGFVKVGEHQDEIDGLEYVMKYPFEEHV